MNTVLQMGGLAAIAGSVGYSLFHLLGYMGSQFRQRKMRSLQYALLKEQLETYRDIRRKKQESGVSWNGWRKFEVTRTVDEGGNIRSVYLTPHDRAPLPLFEAGQYLTLQFSGVPDPTDPSKVEDVVRCYSLSDSPGKDYYRISVKRVPPPRDQPQLPAGRVSNFVHDHLKEGDMIDVRAPGGDFFLDQTTDTAAVLIGGGVGITPVLSMLNYLYESQSQREIWFFYCIFNGADAAFRERLEEINSERDNIRMFFVYSRPDANEKKGVDFDIEGRLGVDVFKELLPSNNYDFYTCGPTPMMKAIREGLGGWGVPKSRIHDEAFLAGAAPKQKIEANVEFRKSGKKMKIEGEVSSLLEFAEANDIEIPSGCRAGSCLTCTTAIRSGEVDYGDNAPADNLEEGCCLPCICVPKGDLVIEA